MSQIKQKIPTEIENLINKLINLRQNVSYTYLALATNFQTVEQPHQGTLMFFLRRSDKVRMDARRLMRFLIRRGGRVVLQNIAKQEVKPGMPVVEAMQQALKVEQDIHQCVQELVKLTVDQKDIETLISMNMFITKQHKLIKNIANNLTVLRKNGESLGESLFDEHVMQPLEQRKLTKIVQRFPQNVPTPVLMKCRQQIPFLPHQPIQHLPFYPTLPTPSKF